jgi:hypothetical protein
MMPSDRQPLSVGITAMVDFARPAAATIVKPVVRLDRDRIRPTTPRGTWRSGGMRTLRMRDAKHHRMLRPTRFH